MKILVLVFPQMTALDAVGPYELLSRWPGSTLSFVAKEKGPVQTDTGMLTLMARYSFQDAPQADVLLIPGGPGTEALESCEDTLNWIRGQAKGSRWLTSVCTGSLVLGAAGLLKDREATTHWAMHGRLTEFGARPVSERFVQSDSIITAAGVSAGIDMALYLTQLEFGVEMASALQLGLEYDPKPPLDAGSPKKAGAGIVSMVRSLFEAES